MKYGKEMIAEWIAEHFYFKTPKCWNTRGSVQVHMDCTACLAEGICVSVRERENETVIRTTGNTADFISFPHYSLLCVKGITGANFIRL